MTNPSEAPPPPANTRRTVFLACAVAIILVAASLAYVLVLSPLLSSSPGSGAAAPTQINVLPSPGTLPSCILGPKSPRSTLPLDNGTFQANTYSLPNGTTGHIGMCYNATAGSLFAYANWSKVGGSGGWFSYPQVTYGVNEWDGVYSTYTHQGPGWVLPQQVSQVTDENVWTVVNYSFNAPPSNATDGYDFSLDDFFTESLPPEFEEGPFVEVMVWFAHHITYPFEFSHLTLPTLVNSTISAQPWDVGEWCHGADNGTDANVSFDYSYDGQATSGSSSGSIGVNLSLILADVEQRMTSITCWTGPTGGFSHFYLDEANMGSEDGALGGADFNYNWTVTHYCFDANMKAPTAAELNCGSTVPAAPETQGRFAATLGQAVRVSQAIGSLVARAAESSMAL